MSRELNFRQSEGKIMMGAVLLINIPSKVWRPKVVSKYVPVEYSSDIEDGIFDFKQYGKAV